MEKELLNMIGKLCLAVDTLLGKAEKETPYYQPQQEQEYRELRAALGKAFDELVERQAEDGD